MAIPSGFIDQLRARVSLESYARKWVRWDTRRSRPDRGEYWARCPFHEEKTPSFKVDDRRGQYYCFGCKAKGGLFDFVRAMENVGFLDAVRILADANGIEVPAATPEQEEKEALETRVLRANAIANQFFQEQLQAPEGRRANAYLHETRGLAGEIIGRFGLGYAPGGGDALVRRLRVKGVDTADALAAGLLRKGDDGSVYAFFRNRIMFPIELPGRGCVGFGARALDDGGGPKYLNSSESPVFQKRHALYNLGPAREAARRSGRLVAVEGYMDVIALAAAGIEDVVAPLGTALGAPQLDVMWNAAPEIVIALDGDAAGLQAADRVVDIALARVAPRRELRFALLPGGSDPDDLVRSRGATGFTSCLEDALPLAEMIWRREIRDLDPSIPERAAALDRRIDAVLEQLSDRSLRWHYRDYFFARKRELRNARPVWSGGVREGRFPDRPVPVSAEARGSTLHRPGRFDDIAFRGWECAMLLVLLNHPELCAEFADEFGIREFVTPDLDSLRDDIISMAVDGEPSEARLEALRRRLDAILRKTPHAALPSFTGKDADIEAARAGVAELLQVHGLHESHRREFAAASERLAAGEAGPEIDLSLRAVAAALERSRMSGEDRDAVQAERDSRARLREFFESRIWERELPSGDSREAMGAGDG